MGKDEEIKELKERLNKLEDSSEVSEKEKEPEKKKGSGCLGFIVAGIVVLALIGIMSSDPSGDLSPEEKSAQNAEEVRKGFHCLSSWDGSHSGLVKSVKNNLRDAGSFEHVQTKIGPVNNEGKHFIMMTYRAANGFGGMNLESASGEVNNSGCGLIKWSSN